MNIIKLLGKIVGIIGKSIIVSFLVFLTGYAIYQGKIVLSYHWASYCSAIAFGLSVFAIIYIAFVFEGHKLSRGG